MKPMAIVLLVFSWLLPTSVRADPMLIGMQLVASDQSTNQPNVQPGLPGTFFWGFPGLDLFGVVLTPEDVGRTFRVTEADSNFGLVAARLTDGVDEFMEYSLRFADGGWGGNQDHEGNLGTFLLRPGPGDIVSAISFRLDHYVLADAPGFRSFRYQGVISIEGTPGTDPTDSAPIPEPATSTLLGTGLAAWLISVRRRRNARGRLQLSPRN